MENLRYENDPGEKGRVFYFVAKGIYQGLDTLLKEAKEELYRLNIGFPVNEIEIIRLEEKIKRLESEKEVLDFVHKCTFDY